MSAGNASSGNVGNQHRPHPGRARRRGWRWRCKPRTPPGIA